MSCNYCQQGCLRKKKADEKFTLSDRDIIGLIKIATKAGFPVIHITGGEPLTRPGILELLEQIREYPRVEKLVFSTNASLAREPLLGELLKLIDEIHISLDATQAFDLQEICGLGQCMNEIMNCAWASCSAGKKTRITCVMQEKSYPHLPVLCDCGKNMDFDICFKELDENGTYPESVVPMTEDRLLDFLGKRYPDISKTDSEYPYIDFCKTAMLKSRIGISHTNMRRSGSVFLDAGGVLHCGTDMRRSIDLGMKLARGEDLSSFAKYFEQ